MKDTDDYLDAVLFRFWIRAASEFPGATARALLHCTSADEYRAALMKLAQHNGINLPIPEPQP